MSVSRRDLIKSLSVTTAAASILRVVPLEAAEKAHRMVTPRKPHPTPGITRPNFFRAPAQNAASPVPGDHPLRSGKRWSTQPAQPNSLIC